MLSPYIQTKFIEKILADRYGRQFRCLFLVAVVAGEVKGKLVSVLPLKVTSYKLQVTKFFLPNTNKAAKIFPLEFLLPIINLFILKDFSFVVSQPTRAPSLNQ